MPIRKKKKAKKIKKKKLKKKIYRKKVKTSKTNKNNFERENNLRISKNHDQKIEIEKIKKQGKITIKRYENYKKLIAEFEIPLSF